MIKFDDIKTFNELPTLKEVETISNSLINILSYTSNIDLEKIFTNNVSGSNIDETKQKAKCSLFFMFYLFNTNNRSIGDIGYYMMIGKYLSYTNLSEDKLREIANHIIEEDLANERTLIHKYEIITQTINLSKRPYTEEGYILKAYFYNTASYLIRFVDFGYLFIQDLINKDWLTTYNNSGINKLFEKYPGTGMETNNKIVQIIKNELKKSYN